MKIALVHESLTVLSAAALGYEVGRGEGLSFFSAFLWLVLVACLVVEHAIVR